MADHRNVGWAVLDAARDAANRWLFTDAGERWAGVRLVGFSSSPAEHPLRRHRCARRGRDRQSPRARRLHRGPRAARLRSRRLPSQQSRAPRASRSGANTPSRSSCSSCSSRGGRTGVEQAGAHEEAGACARTRRAVVSRVRPSPLAVSVRRRSGHARPRDQRRPPPRRGRDVEPDPDHRDHFHAVLAPRRSERPRVPGGVGRRPRGGERGRVPRRRRRRRRDRFGRVGHHVDGQDGARRRAGLPRNPSVARSPGARRARPPAEVDERRSTR